MNPRKRSIQCHSNAIFFLPCKIFNPVVDIYGGQIYQLKTRLDIWMSMNAFPVEYETLDHMLYLMIWLFHFIDGITFRQDIVLCWIFVLLVWIVLRDQPRLYKSPKYQFK